MTPPQRQPGGWLTQERARQYLQAVRLVTSTTMALFEMFVGERAQAILLDAAEHFISRDRTQITQNVLAARLIEARLLKTTTPQAELRRRKP